MDHGKLPLESTTRTFDTAIGKLTYSELSDLIAPKLLALLDDIADQKYKNHSFDEDLILVFHSRIISDVMPDIAGKWRKVPVQVGNWLPPEPYEIPLRMHEYTANVRSRIENSQTLELQIETLAYAEGEFLSIHPFTDFNGRTIRALLVELMMRLNFPPVDTFVERGTPKFKKYQHALAEYDTGRIGELIDFWKDRLGR